MTNALLFQDDASDVSRPDEHEASLSVGQANAVNPNSITDQSGEEGAEPNVEDVPWALQDLCSATTQIGYSCISPAEAGTYCQNPFRPRPASSTPDCHHPPPLIVGAPPNSAAPMRCNTLRASILDGGDDMGSNITLHTQCLHRPMFNWPITAAPTIGPSLPIIEVVTSEPARVGRVLWSFHKAAAQKKSDKENKRPNRKGKKNTQKEKGESMAWIFRTRWPALKRK
ncbi:hypothetical protein CPB86DRAFT_874746 [Serendipita vermifera]|nr:hypothetical protein CPB86DRAFT_874746 [Serendipita vermifera]